MPDKDLLREWQNLEVSKRVWDYFQQSFSPVDGLRTCSPDKVEYFRAQADMMDDLTRIFEPDLQS